MQEALFEAKLALEEGEVPVGAVVVKDGEIIARGHNTRERDLDISGHAEIVALKLAAQKLGRWALNDCALYVTLEPCPMCAGAIEQARLGTLVYGADDPQEGGISRYGMLNGAETLVYRGEGKNEAESILQLFFKERRGKIVAHEK